MREDEKRIFNLIVAGVMAGIKNTPSYNAAYEQVEDLHSLDITLEGEEILTLYKKEGFSFRIATKNNIGQISTIDLGNSVIDLKVLNLFIECLNAAMLAKKVGEQRGDAEKWEAESIAKKADTDRRRQEGVDRMKKKGRQLQKDPRNIKGVNDTKFNQTIVPKNERKGK